MSAAGRIVPLRFDLSALVRKSVATFYSHLVTRPTGQALRLGIESQIQELGDVCVSVLDFSQVVVIDYSCADEAVAKLLHRFQMEDRPSDAYFVAMGVDDRHIEMLEAVLERQGLAMVADVGGSFEPIGPLTDEEHRLWHELEQLGRGEATEIARAAELADPAQAAAALDDLVRRRLVVRRGEPPVYVSISALLS